MNEHNMSHLNRLHGRTLFVRFPATKYSVEEESAREDLKEISVVSQDKSIVERLHCFLLTFSHLPA